MAKDYFIEGYNTPDMAKVADYYRKMLGVNDAEHIDIVEIIEFELRKFYEGFRLVVKLDKELSEPAYTDFMQNKIFVRESIYISAHEGDTRCRMILAHELGHYLLHSGKGNVLMHKTDDGAYESLKGLNSTESVEAQADMFATLFLVAPKLAFELKDDSKALSSRTGVPLPIAVSAISTSKRLSLRQLTQKAPTKFSEAYDELKAGQQPDLF